MPGRRSSDYRTLASLSRINLLHQLQQHGAQTITELVQATGLHHNTAREHLHRLIDAGFVDSDPVPTSTKGRPQLRYRAAHGPDSRARQSRTHAAEQRTQLLRTLLPLDDISSDPTPTSRQLDALDDHLDQCGFDGDVTADSETITMHDCPFAELAKRHPQVCEVHFALVKEALDIDEGPIEAHALHPFSGPHTCTIDIKNTPKTER
ncbi:putative transcriptional regulator [Leifsonia rubra CMS 76R]|nr:putative transcriptional regulator [Leifsonia rubra CMS 76R]